MEDVQDALPGQRDGCRVQEKVLVVAQVLQRAL